jgi:mannose-6-phosphate isomerase-like protein (cupin superfamily)
MRFPSTVLPMRAVPSAKIAILSVFALSACTVHYHYPHPQAGGPEEPSDDVSECAPLLPAPDALVGDSPGPESTHSHGPSETAAVHFQQGEPRVISHAELAEFENQGNVLVGLATASLGAHDFEIWRSSVEPGGSTPLHVHDTEEIFILLRGKGKLIVGDRTVEFEAPATVIAPAFVPHQLVNTGDIPTDQIVVVGLGSEIKNEAGKVMDLPWRK